MESNGIAKTKFLSETELENLRARVQKRFLSNGPKKQPILPNTFLGTYDALREDIIRKLPDAEPSISPTRLRKFFYYTNPALCSREHLEKASFGKDFLDALERYAAKTAYPIAVHSQKNWWIIGALLVMVTAALTSLFFHPSVPNAWREDFRDISVGGLKERGWEFLDFDSTWFNKQLFRDSMLTLWTLPGDNWVKTGEKRQITNLLVHKTEGQRFSVTTKVWNFSPYQASQQISLFLFDETLDQKNWYRLCFCCGKNPKTDKEELQICRGRSSHGIILEFDPAPSGPVSSTIDFTNQSVWLKLEVNKQIVRTSRRLGNEWEILGEFGFPSNVDFVPAFVGIGAFQGWTFDDGAPRNAQIIPAFVDYLLFEPGTAKK